MSELRADTITASDGTSPVTLTGQYAAKAWINFDGTGTVSIRESESIASLVDNGTGDYTINFSNAMTDVNYCYLFGCAGIVWGGTYNSTVSWGHKHLGSFTTTSIRTSSNLVYDGAQDQPNLSLAIVR
jgi:hypothetical protein